MLVPYMHPAALHFPLQLLRAREALRQRAILFDIELPGSLRGIRHFAALHSPYQGSLFPALDHRTADRLKALVPALIQHLIAFPRVEAHIHRLDLQLPDGLDDAREAGSNGDSVVMSATPHAACVGPDPTVWFEGRVASSRRDVDVQVEEVWSSVAEVMERLDSVRHAFLIFLRVERGALSSADGDCPLQVDHSLEQLSLGRHLTQRDVRPQEIGWNLDEGDQLYFAECGGEQCTTSARRLEGVVDRRLWVTIVRTEQHVQKHVKGEDGLLVVLPILADHPVEDVAQDFSREMIELELLVGRRVRDCRCLLWSSSGRLSKAQRIARERAHWSLHYVSCAEGQMLCADGCNATGWNGEQVASNDSG